MKFGFYEIVSIAVVFSVLLGIKLLSSPKTAVAGNRIGALAMLAAIAMALIHGEILDIKYVIASLIAGSAIGVFFALRVTMLKIPQMVALLNGFGGLASLVVAYMILENPNSGYGSINLIASQIAIAVGGVTFSGSMIAAGKLDKKIAQLPVLFRGQSAASVALLAVMAGGSAAVLYVDQSWRIFLGILMIVISNVFGIIFAIRIGGADMPVTISLLNSLSGVAASICGFAVSDPLLIAVGAIVGAAGLILTRIMCRAMNRSLAEILTGRTSVGKNAPDAVITQEATYTSQAKQDLDPEKKFAEIATILADAKRVIVIPGYGMALSQAQGRVKQLYDFLESRGAEVQFAIHPVAGRMPGHMNVLLAEVDVPYEKLCELDDINPAFPETDVVLVVGACDVVNPMAITAEGTPIYGMPILHAHEAHKVIVCNLDEKPGYSGVENPLYRKENVLMALGNAEETLSRIIEELKMLNKVESDSI